MPRGGIYAMISLHSGQSFGKALRESTYWLGPPSILMGLTGAYLGGITDLLGLLAGCSRGTQATRRDVRTGAARRWLDATWPAARAALRRRRARPRRGSKPSALATGRALAGPRASRRWRGSSRRSSIA